MSVEKRFGLTDRQQLGMARDVLEHVALERDALLEERDQLRDQLAEAHPLIDCYALGADGLRAAAAPPSGDAGARAAAAADAAGPAAGGRTGAMSDIMGEAIRQAANSQAAYKRMKAERDQLGDELAAEREKRDHAERELDETGRAAGRDIEALSNQLATERARALGREEALEEARGLARLYARQLEFLGGADNEERITRDRKRFVWLNKEEDAP